MTTATETAEVPYTARMFSVNTPTYTMGRRDLGAMSGLHFSNLADAELNSGLRALAVGERFVIPLAGGDWIYTRTA